MPTSEKHSIHKLQDYLIFAKMVLEKLRRRKKEKRPCIDGDEVIT